MWLIPVLDQYQAPVQAPTYTIVQSDEGTGGTNTLSTTASLPSLPTPGNLLVALMAGDKDTGDVTHSLFHRRRQVRPASTSDYIFTRIAEGTAEEQTITFTHTNS